MKKLIIKFILSVSLIFVVSNTTTITFGLEAAESATLSTYSNNSKLPDLPSEH